MYTVVNHMEFSKPAAEIAADVQREGLAILSQFPGFVDFYFATVSETKCIVILMWETAADAQNGAERFGSTWFAEHVAPYFASPQERVVGEVVVKYEG